ncbi:MAG: DNA polymerase I [Oscillospiraceae bacterium]|nr:DNA polymerase I [Oscillospiraceae bacterium]
MKLLAIDGNSIANRAFYGIKALANKKGEFTNAIYGFMTIYLKTIADVKPDKVAVAFDLHAPTFRHKAVASYKANRHGMPEELCSQMPRIKELLRALGIEVIECEGFEADDILGTLAKQCNESGNECVILTGDRDSLQLITDNVTVLLAKTKETIVFTPDKFREVYGFSPLQLIDLKALMGDSSDNIAGVKGIGEKSATEIIKKYGTIENLYDNIETADLKPAARQKLIDGKESAFESKWLATIVTNATTPVLDKIGSEPDNDKVKEILSDLEMFSLSEKLVGGIAENKQKENISCDFKKVDFESIEFTDSIIYSFIYKEDLKIKFGETISETSSEDEILRFLTSDCKKITCGAKPSYKFCFARGRECKGIDFDAEIAAYLLSSAPTEPSVKRFSDEYRTDYFDCGEFSEVASLHPLCEKLKEEIKNADMENLLYNLEQPLTEVLASMECEGVKIDTEGVKNFGEMLSSDIEGLESQIYFMAGKEFNINSPKQLGEVLFEDLGLPAGKKTKTGYSTNAEILDGLRDKHPIVDLVLQYRQLSKLLSTYVDGLLKVVGEDGRIHSNFKQTETRTGRISSTEPNMQNIPVRTETGREMRKFFVAKEGYTLLDADYSQIELRVVAAMCDDENMKNAFLSGTDIHTATASKVFGLPESMILPEMRRAAKAVNFGIIYGIGAFSLSKDIGTTVKEADRYIKNYLESYSGVKKFMEDAVESAMKNGYVTTIYGRRRYIPEIVSSNKMLQAFGKRAAMNAPVQGSAADIIKQAMVNVYKKLKEENLDAKLILQVHDELIVEVSEKDKERAKVVLGEEMENAVKLSVPMTADVNEGKSWYVAKG